MILRNFKHKERLSYKWNSYAYNFSNNTNGIDIKNFLEDKYLKTKEEVYGEPIYIDPIGLDVIIQDKKGNKVLGKYNYIYSRNSFSVSYNNKRYTMSQIKKNIKSITFLDNMDLRMEFKNNWSDKGFNYNKEYINKSKIILNQLLNS